MRLCCHCHRTRIERIPFHSPRTHTRHSITNTNAVPYKYIYNKLRTANPNSDWMKENIQHQIQSVTFRMGCNLAIRAVIIHSFFCALHSLFPLRTLCVCLCFFWYAEQKSRFLSPSILLWSRQCIIPIIFCSFPFTFLSLLFHTLVASACQLLWLLILLLLL